MSGNASKRRRTVDRGGGGESFAKGSIVRIKLRNFLTYKDVELFPGPRLNTILGPNGSGKSSIVAAINLGLCGNLSTIGRSTSVNDYIMHGKDSGSVEIELYDEERGNRVILHSLNRKQSNQYYLDGNKIKKEDLKQILKGDYHVQLDNPCQFLAQDKVTEFARQDPKKLLLNTLNAVAEPEILEKYQKLVEMSKNEEKQDTTIEEMKENLERLQGDLQRLEPQYRLGRELIRLKESLRVKKMQMKFVDYEVMRKEVKAVERLTQTAEAELNRLRGEVQPRKDAVKREIAGLSVIKERMDKKLSESAKVKQKLENATNDSIGLSKTFERETQKMRNFKDQEEQYLGTISDTQRQLDRLKSSNATPIVGQERENLQNELKGLYEQMRRLKVEEDKDRREREDAIGQLQQLESRYRRLQEQKKRSVLNSPRLMELQRYNPGAAKAWEYYCANKEKFRGQIQVPLLTMDVENAKENAKLIRSVVQQRDLVSFVTENTRDNQELSKLSREHDWRINLAVPDARDLPMVNLDQRLKQFGFTKFASDLISAPDLIKKYLCQVSNLHRIPIGTERTEQNLGEASSAVQQFDLRRFLTPNKLVSIKRSKYSGEISLRDSAIQAANTSLVSASGRACVAHFREEEEKLYNERHEFERKLGNLKVNMKRREETTAPLTERQNEIECRLSSDKKIRHEITKLGERILKCQEKLESLRDSARDSTQLLAIQDEAKVAEKKQLELMMKSRELIQEQVSLYDRMAKKSEYIRSLEEGMASSSSAVEKAVNAVKAARMNEKETRNNALECFSAFKAISEIPQDAKEENFKEFVSSDLFAGLNENSGPQVQDEIDTLEEDIRQRSGADPTMFNLYRRTEAEFENAKKELEGKERRKQKREETAKKLREEFLEPVQGIMAKIDKSFGAYLGRLDYAGSVLLNFATKEDMSSYGIDIEVKFRDSANLKRLTALTQSGGERSVATILYMLALQEMSQVPFRCVDEINQGMDAINERRVFKLMVEMLCKDGARNDLATTQYFMLTPKLLPDLEYGRNMKVLFVFNGKSNEVRKKLWDMKTFAQRKRQSR